MIPDRPALRQLVEQWRKKAAHIATVHATMSTGYTSCADELEAALLSDAETPAQLDPPVFRGVPCVMRIQVEPVEDGQFMATYLRHDGTEAGSGRYSPSPLAALADVLHVAMAGTPIPPAPQWQPIETAPKDGRLILLHPSRHWCEDVNCNAEVAYWNRDFGEWTGDCSGCADDYTGPTHWMPLPDPPAVGDAAARAKEKADV